MKRPGTTRAWSVRTAHSGQDPGELTVGAAAVLRTARSRAVPEARIGGHICLEEGPMKATVDRKALKHLLTQAKRTAGSTSLPVLTHVKLTSDGEETLQVDASDIDLTYTATLDASGGSAGSVLVPVKALHTLIGKLDGDEVTFSVEGDGRLAVTDAEAELTLRTGALDDWPTFDGDPPGDGVTLSCDRLRAARSAVATDPDRPVLCAVLLDGGRGEAVALDGYRIVRVVLDAEFAWSAQVPAGALGRILQARPGETLTVAYQHGSPGRVWFTTADGRQRWVAQTQTGRFPDYVSLWPDEIHATVTADAGRLRKAFERAHAFCAGQRNIATLLVPGDGCVEVQVHSDTVGDTCERVPATLEGPVPQVALDPKFARDMVALLDGDVTIGMRDALKPVVYTGSGHVSGLQMPMRVGS